MTKQDVKDHSFEPCSSLYVQVQHCEAVLKNTVCSDHTGKHSYILGLQFICVPVEAQSTQVLYAVSFGFLIQLFFCQTVLALILQSLHH